jgi:hypothetical protein
MENKKSKWYDTREGIEGSLDTLEHFHELLEARKAAHQNRNEELQVFYILRGKYRLDELGQCWIIMGPENVVFLSVATREEIEVLRENYDLSRGNQTRREQRLDFKKARTSGKPHPSNWTGKGWWPPETHVGCAQCGETWNMSNLHDFYRIKSSFDSISAQEFVGQTLHSMWRHYKNKTDAEYTIPDNHRVWNKKNIDTSPDPEYSTLPVNGNGWYPLDGKTDPEYILQEGDYIKLLVARFLHEHCLHYYVDQVKK